MSVIEKNIADKWYNSDVYSWKINSDKPKFAIDTPPPTVSGSLHMGHVFSYTQADFIARYKRMTGHNVFYPIGFDDNGLPTEKLTEKVHNVRGITMAKEGRKDEFTKLCKEVVSEAELEFEKLFKALGLSFDWSQKYQTISDESISVAHSSFYDLQQKGLIYQASNPVYWCTIDRTALAQADLEDKEKDSEEVTFKCQIDGEEFHIMTTRPEMIPACVAVLYHPDDVRFKNRTKVKMPFVEHPVRLISDKDVKMDKGTGLVMCCSYGDWQDVEWVRRHNLYGMIPLISKSGEIAEILYSKIEGINIEERRGSLMAECLKDKNYEANGFAFVNEPLIKIKDARKLAIDILTQKNITVQVKPIKHNVKCAERSGAPVEIIRVTQWYINFGLGGNDKINAEDFKNNLLSIVEHIEFKPAHLKNRLTDWIKGLNQDWCISRDRFSGVPIPGSSQVFDTWFTSSLSPQLNTKAIKFGENEKHDKLFPFDLRPQAHEIIRTWAFYTIVKAYLHASEWSEEQKRFVIRNKSGKTIDLKDTNQQELYDAGVIPWKTVMLSGWCLASDKTKMSKSKGNIVTPMPLIEEKGADVVRYWASCSHLGVDTHFNETKFVDGKKLINKLKNVAKFISPHLKDIKLSSPSQSIANNEINQTADLWILSRLQEVIKNADNYYKEYNYCQAREITERFFWDTLCDNYLEIVKSRVYGKDAYAYKYEKFKKTEEEIARLQKSAILTVCYVLHALLKLFSPIIPFTTEEIHQNMITEYCKINMSYTQSQAEEFSSKQDSIHKIENWIENSKINIDEKALELGNYMLEIIANVRKYKADQKISISTPIKNLTLPKLPSEIELDLLSVVNAFEAEIKIDQQFNIIC